MTDQNDYSDETQQGNSDYIDDPDHPFMSPNAVLSGLSQAQAREVLAAVQRAAFLARGRVLTAAQQQEEQARLQFEADKARVLKDPSTYDDLQEINAEINELLARPSYDPAVKKHLYELQQERDALLKKHDRYPKTGNRRPIIGR